jgi:hypothetical protein
MKLPEQLNKPIFIAPAAIVAAGLLIVAVLWLFDKREDYAFQKIEMHAPESIVIALMGAPNEIKTCGVDLWWGGNNDYRGKNDGRCVQEAHYSHLFNSWTVGYSQDHHVVSKYHGSPVH